MNFAWKMWSAVLVSMVMAMSCTAKKQPPQPITVTTTVTDPALPTIKVATNGQQLVESFEPPMDDVGPTKEDIADAKKEAPSLIKRWKLYSSADAEALLTMYVMEWGIPRHHLGLSKEDEKKLAGEPEDNE